jgi:DHA1 family multidrug resistance protein-like MFS transporter
MGGGLPHPQHCPNRKDYIVAFSEPHDPLNPRSWTTRKKYAPAPSISSNLLLSEVTNPFPRLSIATSSCLSTLVASFNSAIFAAAEPQVRQTFSVGRVVAALGTSLFVLGFAFGPLIWAPGSELIGRRWPLCVGMLGCSIFTIGSAVSKDIQTLLICRFFAGVFGASPLCVVPAVLSDIYDDTYRGMAIQFYALTVFGGPFLAPIVGEFVVKSSLGWRWTLYLSAFLGFANLLSLLFLVQETFAPLLLVEKAARLRKQTGNWAIHAEHERVELDLEAVVRKYLTRPLRMLATEPIVLLVSMYMSFIYGLVYALLKAYPYVFSHVYSMGMGIRALPFLGLFLGILLALAFILSQHWSYIRKLEANNGKLVPEWRLGPPILGAFVFPVGLFW